MEQVMVVENQWVLPLCKGVHSGVVKDDGDSILSAIRGCHHFQNRAEAETDFHHRQIIPYLILTHEDRYLTFTRLSGQTERRLHGKLSLGVGGHINPCSSGMDPIESGLHRELEEEVDVSILAAPIYRGIILNDTTEVGRVHLGLVFVAQTQTDQFDVRERDKMAGQWMTAEQLRARYQDMEIWSQIVFDALIG